jgi:S-adenosylmethionine/arginine decarboxylase-like enzyme
MSAEGPYGFELILDLHGCDPSTFNRKSIRRFYKELCKLIDMQLCVIHFWDDLGVSPEEQQTEPHTKGTSAVCFILTSSIVVHTLDLLGSVYINIFSCKAFSYSDATAFTTNWFKASTCRQSVVERT